LVSHVVVAEPSYRTKFYLPRRLSVLSVISSVTMLINVTLHCNALLYAALHYTHVHTWTPHYTTRICTAQLPSTQHLWTLAFQCTARNQVWTPIVSTCSLVPISPHYYSYNTAQYRATPDYTRLHLSIPYHTIPYSVSDIS